MKVNTVLILILIASGLSAQTANKEIRKPGSFTELKVYGRFDVILVKGTEESVSIESERAILENVLTELDENKLKVRMKTNYFQDPEVKVVITFRQLNDITAGAGAVIDAGTIGGSSINLEANSGSQIKAEVVSDWLEAESTQGATLSLSGKVKSMEASVNTGGQLNCYLLNCENAKVKVTMGGYAKVYVWEKLDASVNMGGNISYKGNPKEVKRSNTMGGSITEIRE